MKWLAVLAAAACGANDDVGNRLAAVEQRVTALAATTRGSVAPAEHATGDPEWWCDPSPGSGACYHTRHECRFDANTTGTTCVLFDAPFCVDVVHDGYHTPLCFTDYQGCRARADKIEAKLRGNCYRAE